MSAATREVASDEADPPVPMITSTLSASNQRPEMLTATRIPESYQPFVEPSYGLGLMTDPGSPYGLVAGHGGGGPGYSAGAFHFPNVGGRRVTTVALANSDRGDVGVRIAFALAETILSIRYGRSSPVPD